MSSSSVSLLDNSAISASVTLPASNTGTVTYDATTLAVAGPYAVSQEVLDILALMTVRPSGSVIYSLTKLIDDLKSYGIWQVMDVFAIYALHDSQASALNLTDATHKATFVGSPTWAAFQGFAGNGVDAALEHGIAHAVDLPHFLEHDHSLWLWCMSDTPGATFELGANGDGNMLALRARNGLTASFWSCSSARDDMSVTSGRGFMGLSRKSASGFLWLQERHGDQLYPYDHRHSLQQSQCFEDLRRYQFFPQPARLVGHRRRAERRAGRPAL